MKAKIAVLGRRRHRAGSHGRGVRVLAGCRAEVRPSSSSCRVRPVGGAAIDASGDPLPPRDARRLQCSRRGAARRGRRTEVVRPERTVRPGAGPAASCAASSGLFANLRPVRAAPGAARRLATEARDGARRRHHGRARAHRRHLLRRKSRTAHERRRRVQLHRRRRSSASRAWPRGSPCAPRASIVSVDKANVLETSRLWRAVTERVLRDEFPRRHARAHARRCGRDAPVAPAARLRRDGHREHVRRHPDRRSVDARGLHGPAAVGVARRQAGAACTSRSTARRRTSRAAASQTPTARS